MVVYQSCSLVYCCNLRYTTNIAKIMQSRAYLLTFMQAMYQPQGGIIASELCIAAHIQAAKARVADFHSNEKVTTWHVNEASGIVTVKTAKGSYTTRKLVLTAGAWIPDICPELKVKMYPPLLHDSDYSMLYPCLLSHIDHL